MFNITRMPKKILKKVMGERLSSRLSILRTIINSNSKYVTVHNYWGTLWKKFYIDNAENIRNIIYNLEKNLPAYDKNLINIILYRYVFILCEQTNNQLVIYPESLIFDTCELKMQKKISQYMEIVKKNISLANDHYEVSVFYYENGLKLFSNKSKVISYLENTLFIDGGAYNGDSAIVFSKYKPLKIFLFEPSSTNRLLIEKTLELNPEIKQICVVEPYGLSSKNHSREIYLDGSASTIHPLDNLISNQKESINLVTIDDYFSNIDYRIGLLKLDVEGSEYECIIGGINRIRKDRPIMLISIYHTPHDFFYIKPFLEENLNNYCFRIRKLNPFHPTYETTLICYPKELDDSMSITTEYEC